MLALKSRLRDSMPSFLLATYRYARAWLRRRQYRGARYYCNICDSHLSSWLYVGPIEHRNRVCPVCYSYGRHRFAAMVLTQELSAGSPASRMSMLHFAPELGLQRWMRARFRGLVYRTADLYSLDVDINLDVQHMNLPDNSIDLVLLSHVLEHVQNDKLAVREIYRVLTPGGKLFVQVPLSGHSVTVDEEVDTPEMRLARYGKSDHVRLYGDDISTRLAQAGFDVTVYRPNDESFEDKFDYMALDIPADSAMLYASESSTFVCRKPF